MSDALTPFLAATVRTATPLLFAALGELLVECAGMINIGLEGAILLGAFGALVGGSIGGVAAGYLGSIVGGMVVTILFGLFVVWLEGDQIITGMALTLFSLGATGTSYRVLYGASGVALTLSTSAPLAIPGLARIPFLGPALFNQPPITYFAYTLIPVLSWWMKGTHTGLALRAIGEYPEAARVAGVRVTRLRLTALVISGALAGLAGGTLVLAQAGTFAEGMSAGRGFIAIAVVVLGRWRPAGVAVAAVVFGAASALQFAFQAMGWHAPYQLFLVTPYLFTLIGLAGMVGRVRAPASLGKRL